MWTDASQATAWAFGWLLLVTAGFVWLRRPGGSGRIWYAHLSLPAVLLVATVARLLPALWLPVGAGYDIDSYRLVTDALLSSREVYSSVAGRHPYLPFQMYIMGAMAWLSSASGLPYVVALKLPAVAADVAIAGLIYRALLAGGRKRETAVYFGLLYALNPISILVSAYHGQFEAVTLLLLLGAWLAWQFGGRYRSSATALGLAILNKTWPIIFLPVMLMRLPGYRKKLVYLALSLGIPILFTVFYLVVFHAEPGPILRRALTHRGVPGYWGPGAPLALAGRSLPAAQTLFDGLVALRNWLLLAAVLFALRQTRLQTALDALLTMILSILAVTVGFGNQWLVWPLPFALLAAENRYLRWYSLAAALMQAIHLYSLNMYPWLPEWLSATSTEWLMRLSALPAWITVMVWVVDRLRRARAENPSSRRLSWPAAGVGVVALSVGILFFALVQRQPVVSDPIGYLYSGARLAAGKGLTFEDPNNDTAGRYFSLYAFQIERPGHSAHYLGFPPGFPLILGLSVLAGGAVGAMHFVVPALAVLTLLATYFLAKWVTGNIWIGFWAAALLAVAQSFWRFGTAAWSEIPATLAVVCGIALFVRSRQENGKVGLSLLAGAILGYSLFIRYTNITFLPALALFELYTARGGRILKERWRWWFWVILVLGGAAILVFNNFYYGGPLQTSYSPQHGWYPYPAFSPAYALGASFVGGRSLLGAIETVWRNFPFLIILAPVGWYFMSRPARLLMLSTILFGAAIYVVYAFAPSGINSRFLLPILPFIALSIAQGIVGVGGRVASRPMRIGLGIVLGLVLLGLAPAHARALRDRNENDATTIAFARQLTAGVEPNAVVLSYAYNDLVIYYDGLSALNYRRIPESRPDLGRYDTKMLELCLTEAVSRLLRQGIPVYYVEDTQPPYWDSLAILQRHFALSAVQKDPSVYRVSSQLQDEVLELSGCKLP